MKVLITGANGVIGTVLQRELSRYTLSLMDLPENDVRDYALLRKKFPGQDAIVHLAWNTATEYAGSGSIDEENTKMFENVCRAAFESGVPLVVAASSVHAGPIPIGGTHVSPYEKLIPNNPYGEHKVALEQLGQRSSSRGLRVVCIRFGGVTRDNKPLLKDEERSLWLSHRDAGALVRACLTKRAQENFAVVWGISRGGIPRYDLSNPFGWEPVDMP